MDQTGPAFRYLVKNFPVICGAKTKECLFVRPHITKLFRDEHVETILRCNEKRA
jgi:hypothetical protein